MRDAVHVYFDSLVVNTRSIDVMVWNKTQNCIYIAVLGSVWITHILQDHLFGTDACCFYHTVTYNWDDIASVDGLVPPVTN